MNDFVNLFKALDATTKTEPKVEAMATYFATAPPADAAWALYFLSGRKPRQAVPSKRLRAWAGERAGVPEWLFDECYGRVGDVAETISLLLPPPSAVTDGPLAEWVERRTLPLRALDEAGQKAAILAAWDELDTPRRFVWNKLITGGFRVGVSRSLVVRALARASGLPTDTLTHRLMGAWEPTPAFFSSLLAPDSGDADVSRPYPFFLAHPLEGDPQSLGDPAEWQAEWKWDGIRSQVIRRGGQSFVWSRGEELVTDRYPELSGLAASLPNGTALDGEILPWKNGSVGPFADLQKRIGRKSVGKKLLADVPVVLMAYDLLECDGRDMRDRPFAERRAALESLMAQISDSTLFLSPAVPFGTWDQLTSERTSSRKRGVEGLMLKRRSSPYRVGRVRGDWWKWKVEPYSVDAVLIYAQQGHGRRGGLFTDYTFGVWDGDALVPFAKAYGGLTDAEIRDVDAFVRRNTKEKFGPVRTVTPELVFELGFEGIQSSTRHKSGVAVRFPRMLRWRTDKKPRDADTLERVKSLLAPGESS